MSNVPIRAPAAKQPVVDHCLHGLISIRLFDPPASAVAELNSLLGPSQGEKPGEPDISVSFVDDLGPRDELHYLGLNECAFDDARFYLINRRASRATFDFERCGEPCHFHLERGATIFPYLVPMIGLRLLSQGYVLLHASSFVFEGKGILAMGWQKGGKTETMLSFVAAGAKYLADEWTILSPQEGKMWGLSGTLKLWDWHLRCLPEYWRLVPRTERYRLRLFRLYQRLYQLLPPTLKGRGPAGELLERLSLDGDVAPASLLHSAPERLFPDSLWGGASPIDLVLLTSVGSRLGITPIEPSTVADRMTASLAHERGSLLTRYRQFRFAFPDRFSRFLESADERERQYLRQGLEGRAAYELVHPYPVPLRSLYEACLPIVRSMSKHPADRPTLHAEVSGRG